ncbi:hypothetical protein, partial [Streptomyces sp. NPDC005485]|uniref:hypothetical protein n=1 Tax=Streptomyces sp. NPDC005485 TaxID=3155591 RepID=UPI00339ED9C4
MLHGAKWPPACCPGGAHGDGEVIARQGRTAGRLTAQVRPFVLVETLLQRRRVLRREAALPLLVAADGGHDQALPLLV